MKITDCEVKTLIELLTTKDISATEIIKAYLEEIEHKKSNNAYITITEELALQEATQSDERIKKGERKSQLDGIPIAIKDNFLTAGIKTTNASKFYENFIPPYESTVTQKVKDAGMINLGKTNLDEFAMGSTNLTSYFGPVINPYRGDDDSDRTPGGSSGGSAAAVAANMAPIALGTDTGGSVRLPAAFCGLVGLKPTYGVCSRYGIYAFASSLDQAGIISKSVSDNAALLNIIAGYDEKDSTMAPFNKPDYTANLNHGLVKTGNRKFTVGFIKDYASQVIDKDVQAAFDATLKLFESNGVEVKEVIFPKHAFVVPVYYTIAPAEAASNLARYDGIRYGNRVNSKMLSEVYVNSRSEGFGDEVKLRILSGTYNISSSNYHTYINATKVRSVIAQNFADMFKEVDFVITPTAAGTASRLHEINSPLERYYNDNYTGGASLAGLPAVSLPYGLAVNKMPIGIQVIGNYYSEQSLYQIAAWLEEQYKFSHKA